MGTLSLRWRQEYTMVKNSLFNKWCWENQTATGKRMKLEHFLIPYTKISSKWIKDLNVRPDTIKLLEGNKGNMLFHINCSKILFDPFPRVVKIKPKISKWDLIKLKETKGNYKPDEKTVLRMRENNRLN